MIYKKCVMTIDKNKATLDEDIYLYRLDKNIELYFTIVNNKYRFNKGDMNNIILITNASFFQVRLYKNAEIKYTFAIQPTDGGQAILTITDDLIDDPIEVGDYDFQISLLDEEKTSMISMPIVSKQLHVCEPLVSDDATMGKAILGLSKLASGEIKNAFDSEGNYVREIHKDGDILSASIINKFEEALDTNTKAIKSGTGTSYDDTEIKTDINTIKTDLGTETLNTTAKNVKGAVNEVAAQYKDKANKSEIGSPLTADTVAQMTDTKKVYVYTGSESGYTKGNWYTHNGTSWVSGGVYNSQGIGDGEITPQKTSFIECKRAKQLFDNSQILTNTQLVNSAYHVAKPTDTTPNKAYITLPIIPQDSDVDVTYYTNAPANSNVYYYTKIDGEHVREGKVNVETKDEQNQFIIPGKNGNYKISCFRITIPASLLTNYNSPNGTWDAPKPIMLTTKENWTGVYEDYFEDVTTLKNVKINYSDIVGVEDTSYFSNKKIIFSGDSICEGIEDGNGGYATLFKSLFPTAIVQNKGVAGRTIATNVSGRSNPIVNHIDNFDIDADYIILEGGINDTLLDVPKYTEGLTDIDFNFSTGYPRNASYNTATNTWSNLNTNVSGKIILNTDTFQGALETLLLKTMLKYPNKKYGFILTHRLGRGLDAKQEIYWEIARKICKKYRFPLLDLSNTCCLTSEVTAIHSNYFNQHTENDWVHLSVNGYKVGYINKIVEFMKTL